MLQTQIDLSHFYKKLDHKIIQQMCWVFLFLAALFFIVGITLPHSESLPPRAGIRDFNFRIDHLPEAGEYLKQLEKTTFWVKDRQTQTIQITDHRIEDLLKDFRLKGVVEMGERQAIIEDARTNQIKYYAQGEIMNQVQLAEIQQDFVLLKYGDQEAILKMSQP